MKKADPLSKLALEWTPIYPMNREDVVFDIFKHHISYDDGLPPYTQARIIDLIVNRLIKIRRHPALWVSVKTPGDWFYGELKRLVRQRIPLTIQPAWKTFVEEKEFYQPIRPTYLQQSDIPILASRFDLTESEIKESTLRVLRVLARLKVAYRREIASLSGFSESHVRNLLKQLQVENLIERKQIGKYEGWGIRARGLSLAHRSWNIPKGAHFKKYRGEFRYAGERHRRKSRIWRAWLESAYPGIEIWDCWTEVPIRYGIPDALAWGMFRGHETLFWLEVDSGHSSTKIMEVNYSRRLKLVYGHLRDWCIPIVFCIMGPRWVIDNFRWYIPDKNPGVAIIGHDWRDFGKLPIYEFGYWHEDLDASQYRRKLQVNDQLPFDPKKYPSKPKRKVPKPPKQKSAKPRFSIASEDNYYPSGESEREE